MNALTFKCLKTVNNKVFGDLIGRIKSDNIPMFKAVTLDYSLEDLFVNEGQSIVKKGSDFVVFIKKFLNGEDKVLENTLKTHDFEQYGISGLPLKYSREKFISDIKSLLSRLNENEKKQLLSKYNLKVENNDINGVANNLITNKIEIKEEKNLVNIIKKFYYENELLINNPEIKTSLETIRKGLPEFTMMIGKKQHNTHAFSVDIHSLIALQKSMNNPLYKELSEESKLVLKFSTLLHDFGKKAGEITKNHADISKEFAENILKNYDLPEHIKSRILLQIEHHHWFERYNRGFYSPQKVSSIFKTKEDINIAKIFAKSDFESIGNDFHLMYLKPNVYGMTQNIFDAEYEQMMKAIEPLSVIEKKYDSLEKTLLQERENISSLTSNLHTPENGFTLLNGIKDGTYTPNRTIRLAINNSQGTTIIPPQNLIDSRIQPFLDSIINTSTIPKDTILYRGASPFDFGLYAMDNKTFLNKFFKKDRIFTIPIYAHTSRISDIANNFLTAQARIIYKINVPKGTKGIYMEGLKNSFAHNENEILLPRNLIYKFKDRISDDWADYVEVDVLPKAPIGKKIHKFWEEVGEEYWKDTAQMPELT